MDLDSAQPVDPTIPPAWIAFEWNRYVVELTDSIHSSSRYAADNGVRDAELKSSASALVSMVALVDPLCRWLMADWFSKPKRAGITDHETLDLLRGGTSKLTTDAAGVSLLDAMRRFIDDEEDHIAEFGLPSPLSPVRAIKTDSTAHRAVEQLEVKLLRTDGDPQLLLVDEYVRLQLSSGIAEHELLMSRRNQEWFIVFWPSLWRRISGLTPPQPSGPGGDPAGVREPSRPHGPHAQGGAALPLPNDDP